MLTGYDERYSYDGLYRLSDQKCGTLNGTQTAITNGTFEQQWGLDATGNWKAVKHDNDGNGTWELRCNKSIFVILGKMRCPQSYPSVGYVRTVIDDLQPNRSHPTPYFAAGHANGDDFYFFSRVRKAYEHFAVQTSR